jgi:hypothetical protein
MAVWRLLSKIQNYRAAVTSPNGHPAAANISQWGTGACLKTECGLGRLNRDPRMARQHTLLDHTLTLRTFVSEEARFRV